jgi:hypothetical protein
MSNAGRTEHASHLLGRAGSRSGRMSHAADREIDDIHEAV